MFTASYTPQHNGVAERFYRTVTTMARAMIINMELKPSYWSKAIAHPNYNKKRLPHSSIMDFISPFQLMFGEVPNIDRLRSSVVLDIIKMNVVPLVG